MPTSMRTRSLAGVAVASLLAASAGIVCAQENGPAEPWLGTGSGSFYWHNRYHGCLAMAVYGPYNETCPQLFTAASLQRQYPGNTEAPYQFLGKWGPTPKYKSEGIMLRIPEMHKVLMVFKGQYGWQNYNATLSPLLGVGCDDTCKAHTGAIEAWAEVKAETEDFKILRQRAGDLTWSSAGHGFGAMIMQVAAMDLHNRSQYAAYSAHSFGSPPVFNLAAARRWDQLYYGDASQRTVANFDSVPKMIPIAGTELADGTTTDSEYVFVNTGIHVFTNSSVRPGQTPMGSRNMYGQNYDVCVGQRGDERCHGGDNEADHYFYYTPIGHCCEHGWDTPHDAASNRAELASDEAAYSETNSVALPMTPNYNNSVTALPMTTAITTDSALTTTGVVTDAAGATITQSSAAVSGDATAQQNNGGVFNAAGGNGAAFQGKAISVAAALLAVSASVAGVLAL